MTGIFTTQIAKDAAQKQVSIIREFAAPVDQVWAAWNDPAILDQWWGPKPYKAQTISQDFRPGGKWIFTMTGPDDVRMYAMLQYITIDLERSYTCTDAFCDEQGNITTGYPSTHWDVSFAPSAAGTTVTLLVTFASEADMAKIVESGFVESFASMHGNLDELLQK